MEFQSVQTGKIFQVKGEFVEALKIVENTFRFSVSETHVVGMLATRGDFVFQALTVFWEMLEVRVDHDACRKKMGGRDGKKL